MALDGAALTSITLLEKTLAHLQSEINQDLPTQIARSFLLVALNEGESAGELARKAGVSQPTMTRHLLDLGDRNRKKEEGYKLIQSRADPMELRKNQYTLTDKGRKVLNGLAKILQE